ncbi:hypothetical protein C0J52_24645 [Blattella germanica]|nr:hypothetical protein C0J52_24645 [Blattella germanica]
MNSDASIQTKELGSVQKSLKISMPTIDEVQEFLPHAEEILFLRRPLHFIALLAFSLAMKMLRNMVSVLLPTSLIKEDDDVSELSTIHEEDIPVSDSEITGMSRVPATSLISMPKIDQLQEFLPHVEELVLGFLVPLTATTLRCGKSRAIGWFCNANWEILDVGSEHRQALHFIAISMPTINQLQEFLPHVEELVLGFLVPLKNTTLHCGKSRAIGWFCNANWEILGVDSEHRLAEYNVESMVSKVPRFLWFRIWQPYLPVFL